MLSKARETFRILTYRNPAVHGPDAVIVERRKEPRIPWPGRFIAYSVEGLVFVLAIGWVAGRLSTILTLFHITKTGVSMTTLAGALGALLAWVLHGIAGRIQESIRKRINIADKLAPYFGHKIDDTLRTLRG